MVTRAGLIAVYILANRKNGTLYTGVTSDLVKRMGQHKRGALEGFAKTWGCTRLVWYETHDMIAGAIRREKSIKSYRRRNKINLIQAMNPDWRDLTFDLPLSR
ncbi:MAG: GIY-YIG nuclease family protein [Pseudomonadota bacterium]